MRPRPSRSVAVTGLGLVTPLGIDVESTWRALIEGDSGIEQITHFDPSGFPARIAAEVKGFDPCARKEDRRLLKYVHPFTAFALAAAEEALEDANIRPTESTAERWGLVLGSGMMMREFSYLREFGRIYAGDGKVDFPRMGRGGGHFFSVVDLAKQSPVSGSGILHEKYGIRGYSNNLHTACASGGQALGMAMRVIRQGQADRILAGGYDSMINPTGVAGFCLLGALSTDNDTPARASRPFDLTRNGFVLGEGAGFVVLEEWEMAKKRGARIYAELAGEGNSLSSYRITDSHPSGDGPIQAMQQALTDAGEQIGRVDYINAHGTGTLMNDASETRAVKAVFKEQAQKIPVSSTKSQIGHLIAAAGAVEGVLCAKVIEQSMVPMTANLTTPDPDCDLDYVTEGPRRKQIRIAMSNSFGFGGTNSSLVLRRPDLTDDLAS